MLIWEPTEQSQKPIHVLSRVFQNFMRWLPKAHSIFVVVVISYGTSMQYSMLKNAEWVCRTCHSHFVKSKIPPCAVNGMAFPQKPASFFFLQRKKIWFYQLGWWCELANAKRLESRRLKRLPFVGANREIVSCVWFIYRNMALSYVLGAW